MYGFKKVVKTFFMWVSYITREESSWVLARITKTLTVAAFIFR